MTNVPLMFQPLVKYVDFNGRARRSEFWLWVLFRMIVGVVLSTIMFAVIGSSLNQAQNNPQQFMASYMTVMPLIQLVNLGLLLPSLAVGVRRLHDTNRSGWWIVMPFCVFIAGFILFFIISGASLFQMISAASNGSTMTEAQTAQFALQFIGSIMLCVFLPSLIAQIVMLVFYVTDGTPGPNRFGADPKGRGNAAVF